MCHFFSFAVGVISDKQTDLKIYALKPDSHSGIEAAAGLKPGEYREAEWTGETPESLTVRVESGEYNSAYLAAILAAYPSRSDLLTALTRINLIKSAKYRIRGALVSVEVFRADGSLERVERRKNGEYHGKWEWFRADGSLERVERYKDGKCLYLK